MVGEINFPVLLNLQAETHNLNNYFENYLAVSNSIKHVLFYDQLFYS